MGRGRKGCSSRSSLGSSSPLVRRRHVANSRGAAFGSPESPGRRWGHELAWPGADVGCPPRRRAADSARRAGGRGGGCPAAATRWAPTGTWSVRPGRDPRDGRGPRRDRPPRAERPAATGRRGVRGRRRCPPERAAVRGPVRPPGGLVTDERPVCGEHRRPADLAGGVEHAEAWLRRDPPDQERQSRVAPGGDQGGQQTGTTQVAGRTWTRFYDAEDKRTSLVWVPSGAATATSPATVITAIADDDEVVTFTTALTLVPASLIWRCAPSSHAVQWPRASPRRQVHPPPAAWPPSSCATIAVSSSRASS